MKRIPVEMRDIIGENIHALRTKMFPGHGGGKRCAEAFGVSQQQWSPWERGSRTPDSIRMEELADFFKVPVEYFYQKHADPYARKFAMPEEFIQSSPARGADGPTPVDPSRPASENVSCPRYGAPVPGQPPVDDPGSGCGIAESVSGGPYEVTITIRLKDPDVVDSILKECMSNRKVQK